MTHAVIEPNVRSIEIEVGVVTPTRKTELDAVNAIIEAQRADGVSVDPMGATRLVRALVAVGLLHFG